MRHDPVDADDAGDKEAERQPMFLYEFKSCFQVKSRVGRAQRREIARQSEQRQLRESRRSAKLVAGKVWLTDSRKGKMGPRFDRWLP